mmetsp:Transcript_38178/g.105244  ORF Transcript_38178/g.105244 Transcript_38178/m.105244 type:complete len:466 (+) Transcript_38178:58-1455(+)
MILDNAPAMRRACMASVCVAILGATWFVLMILQHPSVNDLGARESGDRAAYVGIETRLRSLAEFPRARCLDGTPAAIYFRASKSNLWFFYLDGGPDCTTAKQCRSLLAAGGSGSGRLRPTLEEHLGNRHPAEADLLSPDPSRNPLFFDANVIHVPYCSADFHAGQRGRPLALNGSARALFAGRHVVEAAVDYALHALGLAAARRPMVLFGGVASGGAGVFRNIDFVSQRIVQANPAAQGKVLGLSIGGFSFYQQPYVGPNRSLPTVDLSEEGLREAHELHAAAVDDGCVAALRPLGAVHRCSQPSESLPYIKTPVYVAQAQSDCVMTAAHGGAPPLTADLLAANSSAAMTVKAYYKRWSTQMREALGVVRQSRQHGLFAPACYSHVALAVGGESGGRAALGPRIRQGAFQYGLFPSLVEWMAQYEGNTLRVGRLLRSKVPTQLIDSCEGLLCGDPQAVPQDFSCV